MAHVAKYTQAQVGHLFNHYNRALERECERSNKDIDKAKTHENYNLMGRENQTLQEYYHNRMNEVYHLDRDNLKSMCDWVVTLPQDYRGDTREFFEHTTEFLNDRYGVNNCIGAFVHMDEKTPHLHYSFIPVVPDRNENHEQEYKVCAKEVLTRKDLQSFHDDLQNHLRARMPDREINITTGITKQQGRNLEVKELKLNTLEKRVKEKEKDLQEKEEKLQRKEQKLQREQQKYKEYDRYVNIREEYCRETGTTQSMYERQCLMSQYTGQEKPYPEIYNPTLPIEERKELSEHYKDEPDREQERDHEHDRDEPQR